tara:strand:+ start:4072 stop:4377 length:306 start_codon:yes stop_codon:yes gene_type:complete
MLLKNQQRKMSIDKARNIASKIDLNYADTYKPHVIFSDKVHYNWNMAEMYGLEIRDYGDEYSQDQIIAMKKLANWHGIKGNEIAKREGTEYIDFIDFPEVE